MTRVTIYGFIVIVPNIALHFYGVNFQLAKDLLHPSAEEERRKCKLKRLVQSPNSYFMDVKCPGMLKLQANCMVFYNPCI